MDRPEENKYDHYKVEDFIRDEYFQQWILDPDEETKAFWRKWVVHHSDKKATISQAADFIRQLKFKVHYPTPGQIESSLIKQWNTIGQIENSQPPRHISKKTRLRKFIPWLAAAVFLGFLAWFSVDKLEKGPAFITVLTGADEVKTIVLPDSSVVTLNANAQLRYRKGFKADVNRELWLKGEAFFKVRPKSVVQTPSPLIVHVKDLDVMVLGTQFNIKNEKAFTNVVLSKGKVKVILEDTVKKPVYMKPGDFLRYSPAAHEVEVKQVVPDLYTSWKDEKVTLDKVPLSSIVQMIEDMYGDSVLIADDDLAKSKISGTLQVKNEEVLLETLSFVLDIEIRRENHRLLFIPKLVSQIKL